MNESQLTDDLRAALDEATAGMGATPGMAVRARASGRRRRATRGLLAGVPVLALAAGAVVALHGSAPASGVSGSASGQPKVVTAAYVTKQVETALGNAANYIIRETGDVAYHGTMTSLIDPRTGTFYTKPGDGPGNSASWSSTYWVNGIQHWRETDVDYTQGTWSVSNSSATGTSTPSTAPTVPGGTPSQLSQALKKGKLKLTGRHADVNGHQAIELSGGSRFETVTYWVDSRTYLPVRIVDEIHALHSSFASTSSVNEFWSPRTPALVKLVNDPVIPAGFRQVPAAPQG
jgi:hypothetical protein